MPPYFEKLSNSLYLAIGSLTDVSLGRKTHFQQVLNLLFQEDENQEICIYLSRYYSLKNKF